MHLQYDISYTCKHKIYICTHTHIISIKCICIAFALYAYSIIEDIISQHKDIEYVVFTLTH